MKKIILIFLIAFSTNNICNAQEWFTSFDIAKRLALVQDKMLLVMWQNTLDYPYPVRLVDNNISVVIDLNENDEVNSLIWEHFVPVILLESNYEKLYNEAKDTRSVIYLDKLKDDSIKIMDINGNILNTRYNSAEAENLSQLINRYGLKTSFLKQELINYNKKVNVTTSFNLASKYLDYALFVQKKVKPEIISLANIYFNEAKMYLENGDLENKNAFFQRIELLKIKEELILNNPKKAKRVLRKIKAPAIDKINESLYSFLNYTIFKLLNDEKNAALLKSKLSSVDLKKAELIINSNT